MENFIIESYNKYTSRIKNEIFIPVLISDIINIVYEYTIVSIMEHFTYIVSLNEVNVNILPEDHKLFKYLKCRIELGRKDTVLAYGFEGINYNILSHLKFYELNINKEFPKFLLTTIVESYNKIIDYYEDFDDDDEDSIIGGCDIDGEFISFSQVGYLLSEKIIGSYISKFLILLEESYLGIYIHKII